MRAYLEAVLEDAIDNSTNTERRFDDRRGVLFFMLGLLTKFEGYKVLVKLDLFA